MARPKLAFEQRLNFWVSQETYDFYAKMAIRRKQKISECLRIVLDKATGLIDESGEFNDSLPMSKEDLHTMMRQVAAEEVARAAGRPVGPGPEPEDPYVTAARKAAESTLNRAEAQSAAAINPVKAQASPPITSKRRRGITVEK